MTQISIGTNRVDVENVGFSRRVRVMIGEADDETSTTLREQVQKFEFGDKNPDDFFLKNWPDGVEIQIYPNHQKRPHRPYVSEKVVEKLETAVADEYPQVPVDEYSFNDLLSLYLDRLEEFYAYYDCVLVGENYKGPTQTEE